MVLTITKVASGSGGVATLGLVDTYTSGVSGSPYYVSAAGGSVLNAYPRYFDKGTATVGVTGTTAVALAVHDADFTREPVSGFGRNMRDDLNDGVQRGIWTLGIAAQTGVRDITDAANVI